MGDDDSGITLKSLLLEAMGGSKEARSALVEHDKVKKIVDTASSWAARKYKLDKEDLKQILLLTIWDKIEYLQHPDAFKAWCYTILRNHCLNIIKRANKETVYLKNILYESQVGKRNTPGGAHVIRSSAELTPDQEFLIDEGVRRATKSFPPKIVKGWALKKTAMEIAIETGKPVKTIYRILNNIEQAIIKEIGVEPSGKKRSKPARKRR